jgi:hypothetical protein
VAKNTVKLKKYLDIINEYVAAAAITPGMLIELTSAGKVQAHSTREGDAVKMFALENELEGEGIADAYALNDQVQCWNCVPGEEVYALLADGENVSIGDFLTSNGDGYLIKYASSSGSWEYPEGIVAQALEALDLTDSSGAEATQRIEVRIV